MVAFGAEKCLWGNTPAIDVLKYKKDCKHISERARQDYNIVTHSPSSHAWPSYCITKFGDDVRTYERNVA